MRTPSFAVFVLAAVAIVAMVAYHALGEAGLFRTLFYLSVAAFVGGLVWLFGSVD